MTEFEKALDSFAYECFRDGRSGQDADELTDRARAAVIAAKDAEVEELRRRNERLESALRDSDGQWTPEIESVWIEVMGHNPRTADALIERMRQADAILNESETPDTEG